MNRAYPFVGLTPTLSSSPRTASWETLSSHPLTNINERYFKCTCIQTGSSYQKKSSSFAIIGLLSQPFLFLFLTNVLNRLRSGRSWTGEQPSTLLFTVASLGTEEHAGLTLFALTSMPFITAQLWSEECPWKGGGVVKLFCSVHNHLSD